MAGLSFSAQGIYKKKRIFPGIKIMALGAVYKGNHPYVDNF